MTTKTRGPRASALTELRAHVEVCDVRYANIELRLGRMEKIMISVAGTTFTTLLAGVWFLLTHAKFS